MIADLERIELRKFCVPLKADAGDIGVARNRYLEFCGQGPINHGHLRSGVQKEVKRPRVVDRNLYDHLMLRRVVERNRLNVRGTRRLRVEACAEEYCKDWNCKIIHNARSKSCMKAPASARVLPVSGSSQHLRS